MLRRQREARTGTGHIGGGRDSGFSLLEVLVATLLLGLAALAYGALMLTAVATQRASWEITVLSATAAEQLESLLQLPFDNGAWQAGGSLNTSTTGYTVDPIDFDGDPTGYLRWEIVDESALMKRMTMLAGRRDPATGETREVRVETFRLRNER